MRKFATGVVVLSSLLTVTGEVAGQAYPVRPVRLLVSAAAGGTGDTVARAVAAIVEKELRTTIVIDNRPGASGMISAETTARARPDGYTLLHTSAGLVSNATVRSKMSFDIMKDLLPIINIAMSEGYLLLVIPSLGVSNVPEFINLAKKRTLYYGTPGIGNTLHFATEYFGLRTGVALTHVPYKGLSLALTGALAGEVQVIIAPPIATQTYAQSGKLVALAYTDSKRLASLPAVPTLQEAGYPDFVIAGGWQGWFAPAGTDARIVTRLHRAAHKAMQSEPLRDFFSKGGYTPDGRNTEEFRKLIRADFEHYSTIAKKAKIQAN